MPQNYSRKRIRDRALAAHWDARQDSDFHRHNLSREHLKTAQAGLQGHIVVPGDPTYNADRLLANPIFDPRPAIIVFCMVESDVAVALSLARIAQKPFSLRSGGHCTAGFSGCNGIIIDVKALDSIVVDPVGMTATVGCGCAWGDFDQTLATYGLHVPGGECPDVCVGGYVQGGGYGFTSGTFGMSCDNVIAMRVMLADGSIVSASQTENYDLWWAMRGGTGGNFGVLLSVQYTLVELGDVWGWALAWPLVTSSDLDSATNALLLLQQQYMLNSPWSPNMTTQVSLCWQPPMTATPPGAARAADQPQLPYLMVRGLWVGDAATGSQAIAPLQALPGCITQWTLTSTFIDLNDKLLNYPYGMPIIADSINPFEDKESRYVERALTAAEWRSILAYFITAPNELTYAYLEVYGGAIAAYPIEQSAFIHRNVAFNAVLDVFWIDAMGREAAEQFLTGWVKVLEPMWNGRVYQNYPSLELTDYAANYWGEAQAGLYAVKCKYDPGNFFSFAQEVCAPLSSARGPGPVIILPPALAAAVNQPIDYGAIAHRRTR